MTHKLVAVIPLGHNYYQRVHDCERYSWPRFLASCSLLASDERLGGAWEKG